MRAELDHLVYGVPDLPVAVDDFTRRTGVVPAAGGRHSGRGTANYLVGIGERSYLEIVGPDPQLNPDERPPKLPFGVELLRAPKLLTWAIRTPDIAAAIHRARDLGYDPGEAAPMARRAADDTLLQWQLTPDTIDGSGGLVPFLIDWGSTEHPSSAALPQVTLVAVMARTPHPEPIRRQLAALGAELEVDADRETGLQAVLRSSRGEWVLRG